MVLERLEQLNHLLCLGPLISDDATFTSFTIFVVQYNKYYEKTCFGQTRIQENKICIFEKNDQRSKEEG